MTFAPATLTALQAYYVAHGGVNLGIVGNARHCKGYHLGRDRIYGTCACKPSGTCVAGLKDNDYSVHTTRDRNGLTDAASAVDLGKIDGSIVKLRDFTRFLFDLCQRKTALTNDVREVIGSVDGKTVLGWSALAPDKLQSGYGDSSHLTHTHISFYRDSQSRDKRPIFAAYFEKEDTEDMRSWPVSDSKAAIVKGALIHKNTADVLAGVKVSGDYLILDPARSMPYLGEVIPGVIAVHRTDENGNLTGLVWFTKKTNATLSPATDISYAKGYADGVKSVDLVAPFNSGVDAASAAALTAKR